MPMSVRLDPKTKRLVERLAKQRRQTKSEVFREAIGTLARQANGADRARRPYDDVKDLIGCVRGGPPDLSVRTGQKFRRLLVAKSKARA
jgi:hypothetical protein